MVTITNISDETITVCLSGNITLEVRPQERISGNVINLDEIRNKVRVGQILND